MGGLKLTEMLLIFAVIMLLFGASRLPQLGSSLGSAIRNFKKGFSGDDEPAAKDVAVKVDAEKKLAEGGGSSSVASSDDKVSSKS